MAKITIERETLEQALENAMNALENMKAEFRALDLPYGSRAYKQGNDSCHELRSLLHESQEPDWKYLFEHECRRSEMWRQKYESIAGPDEKVVPVSAKPQPISNEEVMQMCQVEPVHAPGGVVTRTPNQYREELRAAKFAGFRAAERAYGIKG